MLHVQYRPPIYLLSDTSFLCMILCAPLYFLRILLCVSLVFTIKVKVYVFLKKDFKIFDHLRTFIFLVGQILRDIEGKEK